MYLVSQIINILVIHYSLLSCSIVPLTDVQTGRIRNERNSVSTSSLLKRAFRVRKTLFRRIIFVLRDSLSPTLDDEDAPKFGGSRKSSKRKPSKMISRKKKSRESGISDRLKENILKFRAEEQMIHVEEAAEVTYAEPPNSLTSLSSDSALPLSPEPVDTNVSFIEQRAKIEAEVSIYFSLLSILIDVFSFTIFLCC